MRNHLFSFVFFVLSHTAAVAASFGNNGVPADTPISDILKLKKATIWTAYQNDTLEVIDELNTAITMALLTKGVYAGHPAAEKILGNSVPRLEREVKCVTSVFKDNQEANKSGKTPEIFKVIRLLATIQPTATYREVFDKSFTTCGAIGVSTSADRFHKTDREASSAGSVCVKIPNSHMCRDTFISADQETQAKVFSERYIAILNSAGTSGLFGVKTRDKKLHECLTRRAKIKQDSLKIFTGYVDFIKSKYRTEGQRKIRDNDRDYFKEYCGLSLEKVDTSQPPVTPQGDYTKGDIASSCRVKVRKSNWTYLTRYDFFRNGAGDPKDRFRATIDLAPSQSEASFKGRKEVQPGRIVFSQTAKNYLTIVYHMPEPLALDGKKQSGALSKTPFEYHIEEKSVKFTGRLSNNTTLDANGIVTKSVKFPANFYSTMVTLETITFQGGSEDGDYQFEETYEVSGFKDMYGEVMGQFRNHQRTLSDNGNCTTESDKVELVQSLN